jgi:hypothetical protein
MLCGFFEDIPYYVLCSSDEFENEEDYNDYNDIRYYRAEDDQFNAVKKRGLVGLVVGSATCMPVWQQP